MHSFVLAKDVKPVPVMGEHASGFRRFAAADRPRGAVHTDLGIVEIDADGWTEMYVQSFEENFYVTEGEPVLIMDGVGIRMVPGSCGVIPIGVPHAWIGSGLGVSKWIDNQTPQPRPAGVDPDRFYLGKAPQVEVRDIDIRDPRSRHLFRMRDEDIDIDKLKVGSRVNAPTVSASMATAVLAYSGIQVKMLVDQRLGATQSTMFMVNYQVGAVAHPHDHPLEEAYVILHGEVEAVADGVTYIMKPGDVLWTGVGSIHAFYNRTDAQVMWLETSSPQPPSQHSYRFNRDWDYLTEAKIVAAKQDA